MLGRTVITLITLSVFLLMKAESGTLIELDILDGIKCMDDNTSYILSEGEILKLKVVGVDLKHAWCEYWDIIVKKRISLSKQTSLDGILLVAENLKPGTTTSKCVLLRDRLPVDIEPYEYLGRNYTAIECIRKIHMQRSKRVRNSDRPSADKLKIKIQGELMEMNVTDASILDYDAFTMYYYLDGEIVNTDCEIADAESRVKMAYYDANGTPAFEVHVSNINVLKFRIHMNTRHNGSYIEHQSNKYLNYGDTLVYRTYFILKQRPKVSSIVLVNGLELVYNPGHATAGTRYLYYYIDGEPLELVCTAREGQTNNSDVIQKHLNWRYNGSKITERCGTSENPVDITLASDLSSKTPRLVGLQRNNILYEYTSSAMNDWTIHYQYSDNEILNLTCVVQNVLLYIDLQWTYRGSKLQYSDPHLNAYYNILTGNIIFVLDKTDDASAIVCQAKTEEKYWGSRTNPSVILKLYRIPSRNSTTEITSNYKSDDPRILRYIHTFHIVIFLSIIVATLIAVLWVAIKRRISRKTSSSENIYYEIVYGGPPPLPPRRQNKTEDETHYEKIDDGFVDDHGYCIMRGKACRTPEPPYYTAMQPFSPVKRANSEGPSVRTVNYEYDVSSDGKFNTARCNMRRKTL